MTKFAKELNQDVMKASNKIYLKGMGRSLMAFSLCGVLALTTSVYASDDSAKSSESSGDTLSKLMEQAHAAYASISGANASYDGEKSASKKDSDIKKTDIYGHYDPVIDAKPSLLERVFGGGINRAEASPVGETANLDIAAFYPVLIGDPEKFVKGEVEKQKAAGFKGDTLDDSVLNTDSRNAINMQELLKTFPFKISESYILKQSFDQVTFSQEIRHGMDHIGYLLHLYTPQAKRYAVPFVFVSNDVLKVVNANLKTRPPVGPLLVNGNSDVLKYDKFIEQRRHDLFNSDNPALARLAYVHDITHKAGVCEGMTYMEADLKGRCSTVDSLNGLAVLTMPAKSILENAGIYTGPAEHLPDNGLKANAFAQGVEIGARLVGFGSTFEPKSEKFSGPTMTFDKHLYSPLIHDYLPRELVLGQLGKKCNLEEQYDCGIFFVGPSVNYLLSVGNQLSIFNLHDVGILRSDTVFGSISEDASAIKANKEALRQSREALTSGSNSVSSGLQSNASGGGAGTPGAAPKPTDKNRQNTAQDLVNADIEADIVQNQSFDRETKLERSGSAGQGRSVMVHNHADDKKKDGSVEDLTKIALYSVTKQGTGDADGTTADDIIAKSVTASDVAKDKAKASENAATNASSDAASGGAGAAASVAGAAASGASVAANAAGAGAGGSSYAVKAEAGSNNYDAMQSAADSAYDAALSQQASANKPLFNKNNNEPHNNTYGVSSLDAPQALYGIPVIFEASGQPSLGLRNTLLSASDYKNYGYLTEIEMAMISDLGYKLEPREFYGSSIYSFGTPTKRIARGITSDFAYYEHATEQYDLKRPSAVPWAVGLHVYGSYNNIVHSGIVREAGAGNIGVRIDGTGNKYYQSEVSSIENHGARGIGLAFTYGKDNEATIMGRIHSDGEDGIGISVNFGSNINSDLVEYRGSYARVRTVDYKEGRLSKDEAESVKLLDELNGPQVTSLSINGKVEGKKAAISIDDMSYVRSINMGSKAVITGDIVSAWSPYADKNGRIIIRHDSRKEGILDARIQVKVPNRSDEKPRDVSRRYIQKHLTTDLNLGLNLDDYDGVANITGAPTISDDGTELEKRYDSLPVNHKSEVLIKGDVNGSTINIYQLAGKNTIDGNVRANHVNILGGILNLKGPEKATFQFQSLTARSNSVIDLVNGRSSQTYVQGDIKFGANVVVRLDVDSKGNILDDVNYNGSFNVSDNLLTIEPAVKYDDMRRLGADPRAMHEFMTTFIQSSNLKFSKIGVSLRFPRYIWDSASGLGREIKCSARGCRVGGFVANTTTGAPLDDIPRWRYYLSFGAIAVFLVGFGVYSLYRSIRKKFKKKEDESESKSESDSETSSNV